MDQKEQRRRHLETKIRLFEDTMLRSRNIYEIESIRKELTIMRRKLQKMQYESQSWTLLFSLTLFSQEAVLILE